MADKDIERALDELLVMLKAGNANQQDMLNDILNLQLKVELLDHRTETVQSMMAILRDLSDKTK